MREGQSRMDIHEFLRSKLSVWGSQAELSRHVKVGESAVTKWVAGKTKPDLESCLRIADFYETDPIEIFRMCDRPDWVYLYRRFFPEYQPMVVGPRDVFKDPEQKEIHERVDKIYLALKKKNAVGALINQIDLLEKMVI